MPSSPSLPRSVAIPSGSVPASKCSPTTGRNFSRTYCRTVSRISRSSSSSCPSRNSGSRGSKAGAVVAADIAVEPSPRMCLTFAGYPGGMRRWPAYRTMWIFLLLGWTVSAADRALTGPVVTWMIDNDVSFLADPPKPYALGGLIGGLFFAGYMLTQFPGGYLGDKYGHRTIITISLIWAGLATLLSGVITGLVAFIAIRVLTGLGEGAFYSNDRSLIARETPVEKRSLGMGVVITGLALGITLSTVFAPDLIDLGGKVFAADDAWRMAFLVLGGVTDR